MNVFHRFEEVESKCYVDVGRVNELIQSILIESLDKVIQESLVQVGSITVPQSE